MALYERMLKTNVSTGRKVTTQGANVTLNSEDIFRALIINAVIAATDRTIRASDNFS